MVRAPVGDMVIVDVPAFPDVVRYMPSPTTLMLLPLGGTAGPLFPVKVSMMVPELIFCHVAVIIPLVVMNPSNIQKASVCVLNHFFCMGYCTSFVVGSRVEKTSTNGLEEVLPTANASSDVDIVVLVIKSS